jgi:hypothetical protein
MAILRRCGVGRGDQRVIFLHIGKTAGSTLATILHRHYPPEVMFSLYPEVYHDKLEKLTSLPAERRAAIRLLKGHLPFGVHQHLPAPTTYITMLRNPIDRVMSHYFFVRRIPQHYLHQQGSTLDIEEYVSSGLSWELDNGQLRVVTGHTHDIEIGGCTRALLDEAKHNLIQHFSVVGLSERFDESALLTKRRLGWSGFPVYRKKNVTEGRPAADRLTKRELDAIRKHNELDDELHAWVSARFQQEWEAEGLDAQLKVFRRINAMYQRYDDAKGRVRRTAKWLLSATGIRPIRQRAA